GGRVRLVGRVTPRQAPKQDVPGLEEPPGDGEDLGLVRAEPEDLRPNVEGPGGVAGPPMHVPHANFPARPFGFRDGAVVPIQETGAGGAASRVERRDARTLPREPDRGDALGPAGPAHQARERLHRSVFPVARVLFGPAW